MSGKRQSKACGLPTSHILHLPGYLRVLPAAREQYSRHRISSGEAATRPSKRRLSQIAKGL
jgi:hypothetical protein